MWTRLGSRWKLRAGNRRKDSLIRRSKERPNRVLFFFSLGFDAPSPSLHLMEAMVEDTLRAGWDVHILATHTAGLNPDIPERMRLHPQLTWNIVNQPRVNKMAFARRYLSGIKYALQCAPLLHRAKGQDLIYVQSSPTVVYSILVAKICSRHTPVIYSVQDMFPGSSIHSGVMTKPWMQAIFFRLQKVAYAKADHITVISEDMKQRVVDEGVPADKVSVIVNWYDDKSVHEVLWQDNRFAQKFGLTERTFYVQYAGTMGYVFDYHMVLSVAEILRKHADIEFQMIGEGSQQAMFAQEARRRELHNIRFYPLQAQYLVRDVYSAASVCLVPLKRGIIGNSVPSKVALIMACNRPVINSVDEDSQYFRMFEENRIGLSAPNTDPRAVADAILRLYMDRAHRDRLARNGLEFGEAFYSRSLNTANLIHLFAEIVDQRPR